MARDIHGTQTEKNLMLAFAGESQARMRYDCFASAASKEGLVQISLVFAETAAQEKEHAKRFFKHMQGGGITVQATFPAGPVGHTLDNLRAAADGERHEWTEMYPDMARVAREEGFEAIAKTFEAIAIAEKQHGKRYQELADNLEAGRVFKRDGVITWRCLNCGYLHQGEEAPTVCPACLHPQSYFELLGENW